MLQQDETRCLTVCAPFASLIVDGHKTIENRPRLTHHRGPVLIHAGLRRSYAGHSADFWARIFDVEPRGLVYGSIVGVIDLVDCVRVEHLPRELAGSAHAIGPWCWILANARRLATPIPFRGKLGLVTPDPFTLARVSQALRVGEALYPQDQGAKAVAAC